MRNLILPKFKKKNFPILSSDRKVMVVLLNHPWVRVLKVRYRLGWEIGWSNDDANFTENAWQGSRKEGKAQNKLCNLSRACNTENEHKTASGANRWVYLISLLLDWWNWVSGTTKCTEQSTTNQKHESKPATRCNHSEHDLNKATDKQKLWLWGL
jgi:hypothetical protein